MAGLLALSFDNLGAAAEIGAGAIEPDDPGVAAHSTVTEALPWILAALDERGLTATFFVEGINAELYPEALRAIAAAGHEVGYHSWQHRDWGGLSPAEQAADLARGVAAMEAIGIGVAGFRPPGGLLGAGGTEVIGDAGLLYCSPAGSGGGVDAGIAVLPFRWAHVDASCVLPPLGAVREEIAGSSEPIEPETFLAHLEREVGRLADAGGLAVFVLHPFMLDWFGRERLGRLLDTVAAAAEQGLRVLTCGEAAEEVVDGPLGGGVTLDQTSWSASG